MPPTHVHVAEAYEAREVPKQAVVESSTVLCSKGNFFQMCVFFSVARSCALQQGTWGPYLTSLQ